MPLMQKKRSRLVIWIIGVIVAALVLTDMLPMFAQAQELATGPAVQATDGRILVAQQQQQPRRRKTLMDLLFGPPEEQQQQAPVVERPVVKSTPKADLPPAKPKVEKSPGATRLTVFGDSMAVDI